METHPNNTNGDQNDTVLGCHDARYDTGGPESDEKRPSDGQTIYHIYLGDVQETDLKFRVLSGMYVIRDEGFVLGDKSSPCWVWKGAMRDNKPILRTWLSSYSPRSKILERVGMRGRSRMMCDTPGCIRPHHISLVTHKDVMSHARRHQKSPDRDPKTGRFLPAGSHHPPEPKGS